jgi:dihydroorotate dehydrogenase electron transfer subunit
MPAINVSAAQPILLDDGTITAVIDMTPRIAYGALWLTVLLPKRVDLERAAGRFLLARCGAQSELERDEQWSMYLRRPLFVAARPQPVAGEQHAMWRLTASISNDSGWQWLAAREVGETVNLTGPFGNGFPLLPLTRRLLLIVDAARLGLVSPLVDEALDRGGQVSLLLLDDGSEPMDGDALRAGLPLAVEVHRLARASWPRGIDESLRWTDQVCTAIPAEHLPALAEMIRSTHIRFDAGFAFSLVESDLACGYGACLACVVPLANGSLTRACVHGPVFDLLELAGKG